MAVQRMIRQADARDSARIMDIYKHARAFMAETGNADQWGNYFPPKELVLEDMIRKQLYVVEEAGIVHGVFVFIIGKDPSYSVIEHGSWLSDHTYGTIHRVAGDGSLHGMLHSIILFCENKIRHLRIDTHENNKIMQHLIQKNGFHRCGIIYVKDGTPRIAYEKIESSCLV